MRICVAGGDGRMDYAAKALQKHGYKVTRVWNASPLDVLVLPVRWSAEYQEQARAVLQDGGYVIGGGVPQMGERCFNYMTDEAFLYENARITAEGALMLLGNALQGTVYGCDVGVIGMGRIAECLCRMLIPLGARVSVYARRPEALARARAMGAKPVCFTQKLPRDVLAHAVLLNTVPHCLFDEELLANKTQESLYVELASSPGGIAPICAACFSNMIDGGGIPGKYAPRTAGELIADYTIAVIKGEREA